MGNMMGAVGLAAAAGAVAAAAPVVGPVNFNAPFTVDGYAAELVTYVEGARHPYVAKWNDGTELKVVAFNGDGDDENFEYSAENVNAAGDGAVNANGPVDVPPALQRQVRHKKYGVGTIVRMRPAQADAAGKGRTLMGRFPNRPDRGDPDVWLLPKNIQFI